MMGMDRRAFLKIAGWSALLGLGGKAAYELLAPGEVTLPCNPPPSEGKNGAW
jgi:hypothetical protein